LNSLLRNGIMNKKSIVGIVAGLMITTSAVYFVEISEKQFEEQDMIKGPFFLAVAQHTSQLHFGYERIQTILLYTL